MNLLDSIPGLKDHQVKVDVQAFDLEKAHRLIRDAFSLIKSLYPEGALEWLTTNRSDVMKYKAQVESEVDAAVLSGDRDRLVKALDKWVETHQRAFDLFLQRPPVIDVQDDLFMGAA